MKEPPVRLFGASYSRIGERMRKMERIVIQFCKEGFAVYRESCDVVIRPATIRCAADWSAAIEIASDLANESSDEEPQP